MDGNGCSDLIEWMLSDYTGDTISVSSTSGTVLRATAEETVSTTTGLDTYAGVMLEPTVEFLTFVMDSVMSVFSWLVNPGSDFQFVMVDEDDYDELEENLTTEESGAQFTIDMTPYKTASGKLKHIRYPYFTFSPEELFSGKVDITNINFITGTDIKGDTIEDSDWNSIRATISAWYKVLRMAAIIGLLCVLIYTGIKILLSTTSSDKAKYKELLINWLVGCILVFSMHYIMAFILSLSNEIMKILTGATGTVTVTAGTKTFKTNLIGLARFQIQNQHFTAKISYLVLYTALMVYTFKFTFVYFKRVLNMAFLTLVAPIVAFTYPIDKANDGKAQGFEMWLKEYIFNVLLQPLHYILYYILVASSLSLASSNLLYAVAALMFVSQGEKLLKNIFGFDKAKEGSVGGVAGAYATGALTGAINNGLRNPGGSHGGGNGRGKQDKKEKKLEESLPSNINKDTKFENFLNENISGSQTASQTTAESTTQPTSESTVPNMEGNTEGGTPIIQPSNQDDAVLAEYRRQGFKQNEQGCFYNPNTRKYDPDYDPRDDDSFILAVGGTPTGSSANDANNTNTTQPSNSTTNSNVANPTANTNELPSTPTSTAMPTHQGNSKLDKFKKGSGAVLKQLAKPVYEVGKGGKYNAKRLVRKVGKAALGTGIGLAAATVEAGISLTDEKYNLGEGVAAFSAGYAVAGRIIDGTEKSIDEGRKTYRKGANGGKDPEEMKRYQENWKNRDDVIKHYEREYPGKGNDMRKRASENYVSRGIVNLKDQDQIMKFADFLKNKKNMSEDEADKLAVATFQYRKTLKKEKNTDVLYDKGKKDKYIDTLLDSYSGDASKESVKKLHEEFIKNVLDFEKVNK